MLPAAHHTHTHTIVRVSTEEAAADLRERARALELELALEQERGRGEREFLERRHVLLEQKLAAQEAYVEKLAAASRAGLRQEARQAAAIVGLCALLEQARARDLVRDGFAGLRAAAGEAKIACLVASAQADGATRPDGAAGAGARVLELWARREKRRDQRAAWAVWCSQFQHSMHAKRKVRVPAASVSAARVSRARAQNASVCCQWHNSKQSLSRFQMLSVLSKAMGPLSVCFQRWKQVPASQRKKAAQRAVAQRLVLRWSNAKLHRAFSALRRRASQAAGLLCLGLQAGRG